MAPGGRLDLASGAGEVSKSTRTAAIETALTVGMVFHLPLRQTEGFLTSLFQLLESTAPVPDHTTISRRMRSRKLATQRLEARIGVKILNRMTSLGMPDGYVLS